MEEKKYTGKIAAVSAKNKANGSIGFLIEGTESWFNIQGNEEVLDEILKITIVKGNKIEFIMGNNGIESLKVLEKAPEKKDRNWADDMTNFEDLLKAAHKKGLISIQTEVVIDGNGNPCIDYKEKKALFKATVKGWIGDEKSKEEGEFTGYGDAEGITTETIKPHFIRMAETRAIVRALRWFTNNAAVAEEETEH
jgi:hypothetical protein